MLLFLKSETIKSTAMSKDNKTIRVRIVKCSNPEIRWYHNHIKKEFIVVPSDFHNEWRMIKPFYNGEFNCDLILKSDCIIISEVDSKEGDNNRYYYDGIDLYEQPTRKNGKGELFILPIPISPELQSQWKGKGEKILGKDFLLRYEIRNHDFEGGWEGVSKEEFQKFKESYTTRIMPIPLSKAEQGGEKKTIDEIGDEYLDWVGNSAIPKTQSILEDLKELNRKRGKEKAEDTKPKEEDREKEIGEITKDLYKKVLDYNSGFLPNELINYLASLEYRMNKLENP